MFDLCQLQPKHMNTLRETEGKMIEGGWGGVEQEEEEEQKHGREQEQNRQRGIPPNKEHWLQEFN